MGRVDPPYFAPWDQGTTVECWASVHNCTMRKINGQFSRFGNELALGVAHAFFLRMCKFEHLNHGCGYRIGLLSPVFFRKGLGASSKNVHGFLGS
jgi:hypothetical protein